MNRNYFDLHDPEVTAEDMGRPTRREAALDTAEGPGWTDCGDCGRCFRCVRFRR